MKTKFIRGCDWQWFGNVSVPEFLHIPRAPLFWQPRHIPRSLQPAVPFTVFSSRPTLPILILLHPSIFTASLYDCSLPLICRGRDRVLEHCTQRSATTKARLQVRTVLSRHVLQHFTEELKRFVFDPSCWWGYKDTSQESGLLCHSESLTMPYIIFPSWNASLHHFWLRILQIFLKANRCAISSWILPNSCRSCISVFLQSDFSSLHVLDCLY